MRLASCYAAIDSCGDDRPLHHESPKYCGEIEPRNGRNHTDREKKKQTSPCHQRTLEQSRTIRRQLT